MSDFQEQLAYLRKRVAKIDRKYARPAAKPVVSKTQAPLPAPEDWLHGQEIATEHGVH